MRQMHEAPTVLDRAQPRRRGGAGHCGEIPEVKAVATIGAPSDAEHVIKNFGAHIDTIEQDGLAEVELAGRHFTIKKQFLDDVKGHTLTDRIAAMKKALLVFHSPVDNCRGHRECCRYLQRRQAPQELHIAGQRRSSAVATRGCGLCRGGVERLGVALLRAAEGGYGSIIRSGKAWSASARPGAASFSRRSCRSAIACSPTNRRPTAASTLARRPTTC